MINGYNNPYNNVFGGVAFNQQRLQQLEQQNPHLVPQPPQPQQSGLVIRSRPVSNIAEAIAAQTVFDGSVDVFVDMSTGNIYTKQLNMQTGNCDFKTYVYQPPQDTSVAAESTALEKRIAELEAQLSKQGEVITDVQQFIANYGSGSNTAAKRKSGGNAANDGTE